MGPVALTPLPMHRVGKGHTGYKSMAHLPTSRGFDSFSGFLGGAQDYYSGDRWCAALPVLPCPCMCQGGSLLRAPCCTVTAARPDGFGGLRSWSARVLSITCRQDRGPMDNKTYSSILYGERAVEIISSHPVDKPLFMYLPWQAVHSPYSPVPGYDRWQLAPRLQHSC